MKKLTKKSTKKHSALSRKRFLCKSLPLISIIIPVFNGEKYIERCINSVKNQAYKNIEIIIVNDGSTDGTKNILKKNNDLKIINQKNLGLAAARNVGVKNASGEYLAFVDADDYVDKNFIKFLYGKMKWTGAEITVCDFKEESEDDQKKIGTKNINVKSKIREPRKHKTFHSELSGTAAAARFLTKQENYDTVVWNKLYKTEILKNVKFPEGKVHEDFLTMYKIYEKAKKVACYRKKLYHYVQNENSIMASAKKSQKKSNKSTLKNSEKFHTANILEAKETLAIEAQIYYDDKLRLLEKRPKFELENDPDVRRKYFNFKGLKEAAKYAELISRLAYLDAAVREKNQENFLKIRDEILLEKYENNQFLDFKRKLYLKMLNSTNGERYWKFRSKKIRTLHSQTCPAKPRL